MNIPVVIVLEDSRPRVDWIRSEFPTADIRWCTTVTDFFEELRMVDRKSLRLLVLDHDLGDVQPDDHQSSNPSELVMGPGATWPLDENGNNGMHAVDMLSTAFNDVPVIVWSINTPRAQEMVHRLTEKGYGAAWLPHSKSRYWQLRAAIAAMMEDEG